MNSIDHLHLGSSLAREMAEAARLIRTFDSSVVEPFATRVIAAGRLMLSGEGSSRIFPAKQAIARLRSWGSPFPAATEGGRQAMEYDLGGWAVLCASNSGRTREMLGLLEHLAAIGNADRFGLTARLGTPLEALCTMTHVLGCGPEEAVAATKSVVEQALFCDGLVHGISGLRLEGDRLRSMADAFESALGLEIPEAVAAPVARASRVYFSGRNDGVAEELTLKANEIARLSSAFLEGTYAVHGIEEVMTEEEVAILVEPFASDLDKFTRVLAAGVGMTVVAISSKPLPVPTVVIPSCPGFDPFVRLAAGWNLLLDSALRRGVDPDNPVRARKVGNETVPPNRQKE